MRFFVLIYCLLLTGCTHLLWENKDSYLETVVGFYLVEDEHKVLAVGENYSYMFEIQPDMYGAIKLSNEIDFTLKFESFSLNEKNIISGHIELSVAPENLSENQKLTLSKLGFKNSPPKTALYIGNKISGIRYIGEGSLPATKFENDYKVTVEIPDTYLRSTGKVIATPATLTFDVLVMTQIYITIIFIYAANGSFN